MGGDGAPHWCIYEKGELKDGSAQGTGLNVLCAIDTQGYDSKPTGADIGAISNRFSQNTATNVDLCELAAKLSKGHTALFSACEGRRAKDNWSGQQLFAIDIDNDAAAAERGYRPLSYGDAIDRAVHNRLPLVLSYLSYSSSPDPLAPAHEQRYRLVFALDEPIRHKTQAGRYAHALYSVYPEADSSTVQLERMFYGTDKEVTAWHGFLTTVSVGE